MDNLCSSIYGFLDLSDAPATGFRRPEPVRIAILDSGFDRSNPLLMDENRQFNPQIKQACSFVHNTEAHEYQDDIGHGSHTLGLLLKVAPCAEIYIAKIAGGETLDRDSYDDIAEVGHPYLLPLSRPQLIIAQAINHAVSKWNVDVISMSFGIREYHGPIKSAIADALHKGTLMFAAASNDGGNSGRAFPAASPGVFCIHSTNGNGSPSDFNPTAHDTDINFSLLGEDVSSHWPAGKNGHNAHVKAMSGTSIATPIAAGLAASILSFVRQQESGMVASNELLSTWLKDVNSMDDVLKTMVRRERQGFGYITPHELFDLALSKQQVYDRIKELKRKMYS
jgi:subtilisin family serine protease